MTSPSIPLPFCLLNENINMIAHCADSSISKDDGYSVWGHQIQFKLYLPHIQTATTFLEIPYILIDAILQSQG